VAGINIGFVLVGRFRNFDGNRVELFLFNYLPGLPRDLFGSSSASV
jgi:hypothetical protein